MKPIFAVVVIIAAASGTGGCSTSAARDPGGPWQSMNRFADTPTKIELHAAYVFYASPLDGTLQGMLKRWAEDSGRTLDYQARVDYTLHKSLAKVRDKDIDDAVRTLTSIYAKEGIGFTVDGARILVRSVSEERATSKGEVL